MGARWTDPTFSRRDDARPPVRVDAGTTTSRGSCGTPASAGGQDRRPWFRRQVGTGGAAPAGRASHDLHRCAPYGSAADIEPARRRSIDIAIVFTAACVGVWLLIVAVTL